MVIKVEEIAEMEDAMGSLSNSLTDEEKGYLLTILLEDGKLIEVAKEVICEGCDEDEDGNGDEEPYFDWSELD